MRTRLENGVEVDLTEAEETARDAEELSWANRDMTPPPDPDVDILSDIADAGSWQELQAALLGNGPKQAKVRGRK